MNGYWYCDHCDDVVTLPRPAYRSLWAWPPDECEACPVCHKRTARFVIRPVTVPGPVTDEPKPVTPERARELLAKIRKSI